ncbi:transposase [Priestia megaterium]
MTYRSYSLSFKLEVVREFMVNKKVKGIQSKIAKKYGISNYSVSTWVEKYKDTFVSQETYMNSFNCLESAKCTEHSLIVENEILKSIIIKKEIELNQLKNQLS